MSKTKTFSTSDNKVKVKMLGRTGSAEGLARPGYGSKISASGGMEPTKTRPGGPEKVRKGSKGSETAVARPGGNQKIK